MVLIHWEASRQRGEQYRRKKELLIFSEFLSVRSSTWHLICYSKLNQGFVHPAFYSPINKSCTVNFCSAVLFLHYFCRSILVYWSFAPQPNFPLLNCWSFSFLVYFSIGFLEIGCEDFSPHDRLWLYWALSLISPLWRNQARNLIFFPLTFLSFRFVNDFRLLFKLLSNYFFLPSPIPHLSLKLINHLIISLTDQTVKACRPCETKKNQNENKDLSSS